MNIVIIIAISIAIIIAIFISIRIAIIIAVIILLLFGGRKIPELMRGLGSGIKEFKKAAKDGEPKSNSSIESGEEKDIKE